MPEPRELITLPRDILVLLPGHLNGIKDLISLSKTCKAFQYIVMKATLPNTILRLAAKDSPRLSHYYLVAATARQLGNWARKSPGNERELALKLEDGLKGLLGLALKHCGLSMERVKELHYMRGTVLQHADRMFDRFKDPQYNLFLANWENMLPRMRTKVTFPRESFFQLAIYGSLFGPDMESFLRQDDTQRRLRVETRLEYVKYCIPDWATTCNQGVDPRRDVKLRGIYAQRGFGTKYRKSSNLHLSAILLGDDWRVRWGLTREAAGIDEFTHSFEECWYRFNDRVSDLGWRQRIFENLMVCQGLEGFASK